MEDRIIQILEEITGENNLNLNNNVDLLEEGIIDSLAFVELTMALEEEFEIEIQPTQVSLDTWRSIEKIARLVEKFKK